jgi:shikimate dehydrogenase
MFKAKHIDGSTRPVGLFGYPVAHSLSPHIHNHAFCELGLPFVYVPLEIAPEKIADAVAGLRSLGFAGANVTIPHKQAIAKLCDEISALSTLTATVNTLYFKDGRLRGTTTDPEGFLRALSWAGHSPNGGTIVILGNGGTARTLGFALAHDKIPKRLIFAGRNEQRVSGLADQIQKATGFDVEWVLLSDTKLADVLSQCTLCVNCTSAGMHPDTDTSVLGPEHFHSGMTVLDTIYNPAETKFLSYAKKAGCRAQNGLRMLLYQGLASFKYWTGVEAPESLFDLEELQRLVSK